MQPTFFSIIKENAFHGPHSSWLNRKSFRVIIQLWKITASVDGLVHDH